MELANSEWVLDRAQGLTQGALASYYVAVAGSILPHVADRPLSLVRRHAAPGDRSFTKRGDDLASDAIDTVAVRENEGVVPHATIHDERGLVALVEAFALEIHASAARASDLEHPDRLVFELEPGENLPFAETARAAKVVRALLQGLELESFAMTRGSRGVDVVVPIKPELDWVTVREFAAAVVDTLVAAAPTRYASDLIDARTRNKIRLGYLADPGATFVAPYSTQLLSNAPVALPTFWYELEAIEPEHWTPGAVLERLETLPNDPWEEVAELDQRLTPARRASLSSALRDALGG